MARRDKRQRSRDRRKRRLERKMAAALRPAPAFESQSAAHEAETHVGPFVIDEALSWHVVRMAPRMKDVALKAIASAKAVPFQPCTVEKVTRRGRRVDTLRPTLARTVFIGVQDDAHLRLVRQGFEPHPSAPPVAEVVCHLVDDTSMKGNLCDQVMKPFRIKPEALQEFANNVHANEKPGPVQIVVGQRVIVTDGPFFSLPAKIEEVLPTGKVKVLVSMFGAPVPVELDLAQIRVVA